VVCSIAPFTSLKPLKEPVVAEALQRHARFLGLEVRRDDGALRLARR
jgi:hypothetical protein